MSIKPYCIVLVHEDQPEPDGVPTEIVAYTWTFKGGERLKDKIWKTHAPGKWMMVIANSWMWWWTINCGSVYVLEGFDEETANFATRKIAWWRRE